MLNSSSLGIIKNGFGRDLFLSNTLINVYFRTGDLVSAHVLFDEMPLRNSVSWACLISGYAQNGMPSEACAVFREMIRVGLCLNTFAVGSALRACQVSGPRGLRLGVQIHGLVSKTPYAFDAVVCNVLISMYGHCIDWADLTFRAFDGIKMKNSVSWNSIISVCSQRGDAISAFELFSSMQQEGVGFGNKPSEYTFGSLVTAAASMDRGLCLLEQMLVMIKKSGFMQDLYVGSALVSGFARFGLLDMAKKIFELMSEKSAVTMNGLMVGLVRQKRGEEATEIFVEMNDLVKVNSNSFVVLLSAFPEFSVLEKGRRRGKEVHAYVVRTGLIDSKVEIGNGLVNMYAKCEAIDDACTVFGLMSNKDSVSWNSMISGLDQNECFESAVRSFRTMRTALMPSNFTLISSLNSCGSLGWINLGEQIHCEGIKLGLDLDVSVSNALLAIYAETGCISESRKVFYLMADHDQVSWNSVIGAFAGSEEYVSEAVRYFFAMMQDGLVLNRVTFINILSAVTSMSHHELGRQVHALVLKHHFMDDTAIENALLSCYGKCGDMDDCEKIFARMSERRDYVSWNSMISGYIHNELLPKAMDLVWFMLQRGQRLDCFTFATVLSACASVETLERGMEVHASAIRAHLESDVVVGSALVDIRANGRKTDLGKRAAEMLLQLEPQNAVNYVLLSNMYASGGKWHDVAQARAAMREASAKKEAGFIPSHGLRQPKVISVLLNKKHIFIDFLVATNEMYRISRGREIIKKEEIKCRSWQISKTENGIRETRQRICLPSHTSILASGKSTVNYLDNASAGKRKAKLVERARKA
ncbi:tetratricopeptide repeat (TPR)-like superfamily protein [Actinidia rufa]|uniref:Tetratricopeptide repeat (TPR)-like superfamily protein n=1 Tax=Actinidia rufa TaxID=165716 RepID=A0A7J0G362_9ERIC|nr:tetratricopeptide repeat (TPR)-like superfamily protein [Actinidia rufa]